MLVSSVVSPGMRQKRVQTHVSKENGQTFGIGFAVTAAFPSTAFLGRCMSFVRFRNTRSLSKSWAAWQFYDELWGKLGPPFGMSPCNDSACFKVESLPASPSIQLLSRIPDLLRWFFFAHQVGWKEPRIPVGVGWLPHS